VSSVVDAAGQQKIVDFNQGSHSFFLKFNSAAVTNRGGQIKRRTSMSSPTLVSDSCQPDGARLPLSPETVY
jgi:hypothetical protein